jgi:hypothetical protein
MDEYWFDVSVNGSQYTATFQDPEEGFADVRDSMLEKPNVYARCVMPDSSHIFLMAAFMSSSYVVFTGTILINSVPTHINMRIDSDDSITVTTTPLATAN